MVAGVVVCAAAAVMYLRLRGDVLTQFALAVSMCGQGLFAAGVLSRPHGGGEAAAAATLAVFQLVLVVVMRNPLHRTLSSLFTLAALAFAVGHWDHWALGGTLVSLLYAQLVVRESAWRTSPVAEIVSPVLPSLAIGTMAWYIPSEWLDAPGYLKGGPMLAVGVSAALVLLAAEAWRGATLVQRLAAVAGATLFCLGAWQSPGVIASALVIAGGFRMGSRETMALGIAAFVAYLGAHYHFMATTLLVKAGSLAIAGAVLLAAAALLHVVARRSGR
jgi:hypothetical protein